MNPYTDGLHFGQHFAEFALLETDGMGEAWRKHLQSFGKLRSRFDDAKWAAWQGIDFIYDVQRLWLALSVVWEVCEDLRASLDQNRDLGPAMQQWARWIEPERASEPARELRPDELLLLEKPAFVRGFIDGALMARRRLSPSAEQQQNEDRLNDDGGPPAE